MLHHLAALGNTDLDVPGRAGGFDAEVWLVRADDELNVFTAGVQLAEDILQQLAAHDNLAHYVSVGTVEVQTLLRLPGVDLRVTDDPAVLQEDG